MSTAVLLQTNEVVEIRPNEFEVLPSSICYSITPNASFHFRRKLWNREAGWRFDILRGTDGELLPEGRSATSAMPEQMRVIFSRDQTGMMKRERQYGDE